MLLVEDNIEIQKIAVEVLRPNLVKAVGTLKAAEEVLSSEKFDLLILDISLPDGDGIKFYAKMQGEGEVDLPVVFLTCETDPAEKVTAFTLGAEDYITKPFNHSEFRARIESKLKKQKLQREKKDEIKVGNLVLNITLQRAIVFAGGRSIQLDLTPHEFKLLTLLAKNMESVFTREYLLDEVWGRNVHVVDSTINTHISNLRKKLKGSTHTIRSVYGTGYALAPVDDSTSKMQNKHL